MHHYEEQQEYYNSLDPLTKTYTFFSDSLLSKWGFGDGNMLDELCGATSHDDLALFVDKIIVSQITSHKVTARRVHTIHNPIRAEFVDGVEALYPVDERFELKPEKFSYTGQEILEALEKLRNEQK